MGGHDHNLRRFGTIKPGGRSVVLKPDHAAVREGRTLFPSTVAFAEETQNILKSGHHQRKIGKVVQKGRWRGFPIFTLTLEERATCPSSCRHWRTCYGNNMHFAQRIVHDADFEELLWLELEAYQRASPDGYVVRLHILGDFYSVEYVQLWERALEAFPALHVFGYTARCPGTDPIGRAIHPLTVTYWDRFAIRYSGLDEPEGGSVTVEHRDETPHIICPAQTGRTECCATCGLCWQSKRTIAFLNHGSRAQ